MRPQPTKHLVGALVRREDWIEYVLDKSVTNDQREALQQARAGDFKRRQAQRVSEFKFTVAQNLERKMEPFCHLTMVFGCLRAQAKQFGTQLFKFMMVIS